MRIKMRVHFAGAGFSAAPGDEIDRPDTEAIRLIEKGYASPLGQMPLIETAVRKPEETRATAPEPAPAVAASSKPKKPARRKRSKGA